MTDSTASRSAIWSPATRRPGRRSTDRSATRPLFAAVRGALHALEGRPDDRPDRMPLDVPPARVAQYLRAVAALVPAGSSSVDEAVTAVTAACADLETGDLPGARLALRAADSALHEPAPQPEKPRTSGERE